MDALVSLLPGELLHDDGLLLRGRWYHVQELGRDENLRQPAIVVPLRVPQSVLCSVMAVVTSGVPVVIRMELEGSERLAPKPLQPQP